MTPVFRRTLPCCFGGIALLVSLQTLAAPETLPEILVTAELRETSILQTSNSTSVLGGDAIRQRAAQHLEDVLNLAPNVNFAGGTSRARYVQIRGVGDRSQFQEPLNPSVGLRLDGVDFSGIGGMGTLYDVEQVEVLRGPQGTLHGANALAGLIDLRSNAPTEDFYHRVDVMAGDYDSFSLGAVSSGPLTPQLRYRVAAEQFRSDGYTENRFLGIDNSQERDELTLRGRLRWLVNERHTLDVGVNYINVDNGYDAFSLDNPRRTISDQPGRDAQESLALSVNSSTSFEAFELQTLVSYAHSDIEYSFDEDWTFEGFHPFGYSSTDQYLRQRDSLQAELRLVSAPESALFGGRSDWVAGLYYLENREDLDRRYTFAGPFDSQFDTRTIAAFGQLDTALGERLNLVTGLRLEQRETDYRDSNTVAFDPDNRLWGGKLALEYQRSDSSLLYASLSRGYRADGVNGGILASLDASDDPAIIAGLNAVRQFEEETLLNYELGWKASLLDERLQARLALFYMDREDQQVRGAFLIPRPGGATTFLDYTSNAAEGENVGAELELDWLVSDRLRLWANLGLLETEFTEYVNAAGEDLSGRAQSQAPDYQFAVGGRLELGHGFSLRVDLEGKDAFFFSDRHEARSNAYELLHARLGYSQDRWSVALWGRNLTDEDVAIRGFGSFGNDPRLDYAVEEYVQLGEPRMLGVSARVSF
ncbi:MAG: TonB-dependent receptor [Halieaceae bacterium]|nr:TonB-dependent receptor [Halieaceae bacterium]